MKILLVLATLMLSSSVFAKYCATIYQGQDMTGAQMDLYDGDKIKDLSDHTMDHYNYRSWDNKISSITVNSGCKLVTFQYQNMGRDWNTGERIGHREVYRQRGDYGTLYVDSLYEYDNMISSLKCKCR